MCNLLLYRQLPWLRLTRHTDLFYLLHPWFLSFQDLLVLFSDQEGTSLSCKYAGYYVYITGGSAGI